MNLAIIIGLIVLGIVFVLLELFFLPGISVASIIGLASFGGAVYFAYLYYGAMGGTIALAVVLLLSVIAIWLFFRSKTLDKMALNTEISSSVAEKPMVNIGDTGICLSRLAPMGKVLIDGKTYEARSEGDMIDEGLQVEVISVEAFRITVKPIDNQ